MSYVLAPVNRYPTIMLMYCYFDPTTGRGGCHGVQVEFPNHDVYARFRQQVENLVNEMTMNGILKSRVDISMSEGFQLQIQTPRGIQGLHYSEIRISEESRNSKPQVPLIPLY